MPKEFSTFSDQPGLMHPAHCTPLFPDTPLPDTCVISLFPFLFHASCISALPAHTRIFHTLRARLGQRALILFNTFGAACTAFVMELCIARGIRRFILFGSAGILDPEIRPGEIILPDRCVPEEGVSAHYLAPGREARAERQLMHTFGEHLRTAGFSFRSGMHWTTDAPFRETPEKVRGLIASGCLSVDMETSALYAVAAYREVSCLSVLVGMDRLTETAWMPSPKGLMKKKGIPVFETLWKFVSEEAPCIDAT